MATFSKAIKGGISAVTLLCLFVMQINEYTISDVFNFAEEIQQFKLGENVFLVSYDVTALFTNVPLDETIHIVANKAVKDNWFNKTYNMNISKDDLIDLLSVATKKSAISI